MRLDADSETFGEDLNRIAGHELAPELIETYRVSLRDAREAGLPAPYACKAGVCATCRAKVVTGSVEQGARYGLTDEEIEAGYILTCQSVPVGDDVRVDYDA